jgi:hypothetical protein
MSDEVERIGYGRPPKKTQFKKGDVPLRISSTRS